MVLIKKMPDVKVQPTTATGIVFKAILLKMNEMIDVMNRNEKFDLHSHLVHDD